MRKPAKRYATLTDAALQRLVAQDDTQARRELTARRYMRLLATQGKESPGPRDLLGAAVLAEGVYGYYLTDDLFVQLRRPNREGPVTLWIKIDTHTTQEQITAAWSDIAAWRDRIAVWQLPDDGRERYLLELHRAHKHKSYAALARQINAEIAAHLARCWADWQAEQNAQKRGEPLGEWRARTGHLWFLSLYAACFPLQALGMPATDVGAWLENGLQNLQQGQPAFPPDAPITPERVREALRYWRKQHQEWLDNQSR